MVPEGFGNHGNFIAKDDLACSRLSDSGEGAKEWERRESLGRAKMGAGAGKSFLPFFFVFALPQFRWPDYLGAWNRLKTSGRQTQMM